MKNIFLLFSILFLFSCGRFSNKQKEISGERIVCVSKQLNEMIFALGEGRHIVAVDVSSTFPPDSIKNLTTVGYHRMLSAEGIISMRPDVVFHDNNIGPANVMPQLEEAGVKIKSFTPGKTMGSAQMLLKELGEYFHVPSKADSLIKKWNEGLKIAKEQSAILSAGDTLKVMVIQFGRANNVYFVMSGRGGVVDEMIQLAGGKPAMYGAKDARQISAEAMAISNPDIIVATDFGFDKMGSAENFKQIAGVALTNAAKNNRIYRFDEHDLVYFGPRTGENVIKLMNLFFPQNVSK